MARDRTEPLGFSAPTGGTQASGQAGAVERQANAVDRWVGRRLAGLFAGSGITFVFWDGTEFATGGRGPRVCFADRGALYRLLTSPTVQFGDLYSAGRISVEGNLIETLHAAYKSVRRDAARPSLWQRFAATVLTRPGLAQSRKNIHHHYDLGNDFYELWLDRDYLQYTCAYYRERDMTLEQAQYAKMDHVCRKLQLKPGETVVEAGSGWGGFAIFMAREYGARVRAVNISTQQIAYAREWAAREGLADRVEFVEQDFRDIEGQYDVFVSIGMLEHVGPGNYRTLGEVVDRSLKPDGRGLIHSIGRDRPAKLNPWIRKRIFPGAYPPSLGEMSTIFEPVGLSVLDVENLRLHYARTLTHWLARYEEETGRVQAMFDESFVRAWRLYLSGSVAAFSSGSLQLFQVLFARSGSDRVPWTRAHLYSNASSPADPR